MSEDLSTLKRQLEEARKELSDKQKHVLKLAIQYGEAKSKKHKVAKPAAKAAGFVCGGNPLLNRPCPGGQDEEHLTKASATRLEDGTMIEQCVACKRDVKRVKRLRAKSNKL